MSRIGRLPITLPSGVTADINGTCVEVKGPKGTLKREFSPLIMQTGKNTASAWKKIPGFWLATVIGSILRKNARWKKIQEKRFTIRR